MEDTKNLNSFHASVFSGLLSLHIKSPQLFPLAVHRDIRQELNGGARGCKQLPTGPECAGSPQSTGTEALLWRVI